MAARTRARYLAPVALAATITATYLVAQRALTGARAGTASHLAQRHVPASGRGARTAYYIVRPGDSLSTMAARTGVPLSTLEALNRVVHPDSLQEAQRLRLRR